jgi:hypothetical protein
MRLAAAKKGKLGKDLITSWCAAKGLDIEHPKDKKVSLVINGNRFASKFSTLWSEGSYKFQQIRNQGYDYLICLGISPLEAHCWVFTREYVLENVTPQHKGAENWITIDPNNPPSWAEKCGGTLDQAFAILKNLKRKS